MAKGIKREDVCIAGLLAEDYLGGIVTAYYDDKNEIVRFTKAIPYVRSVCLLSNPSRGKDLPLPTIEMGEELILETKGRLAKIASEMYSNVGINVDITDLRAEGKNVIMKTDSGKDLKRGRKEFIYDIKTAIFLKARELYRQYGPETGSLEELHSFPVLQGLTVLSDLEQSLGSNSIMPAKKLNLQPKLSSEDELKP